MTYYHLIRALTARVWRSHGGNHGTTSTLTTSQAAYLTDLANGGM